MKLRLPSGLEVSLCISHRKPGEDRERADLGSIGPLPIGILTMARTTIIGLRYEDNEHPYFAQSLCKPPDQFCRRTGRELAAHHLLRQMRKDQWAKTDRRAVFFAICPEYGKTEAQRIRTEKELPQ